MYYRYLSLMKTSFTNMFLIQVTGKALPFSGTPGTSSCDVTGPACIAAAKRRRSAELKSPLIRQ